MLKNKINPPKILVVGSINMDLTVVAERFPKSGESVMGTSYRTTAGGKGANQAVQAARLGADVTMIGKVGNDAFGDTLVDGLIRNGVQTETVLRSKTRATGVSNIQLETGFCRAANRIVVVPGANMDLKPEEIGFLRDDIGNYDMVLLQLEIPAAINTLVSSYAVRKKVPVMLNCAPMMPLPAALLANTAYISPNEHEAHLLTGIEITDGVSIQRAIERIRLLGVKNVLITMGHRGVVYWDGEKLRSSPAVTNLDLRDTTGAGDSFVAAFCTAITCGAEAAEALTFANYTAALTVCRPGAQDSMPTLREVLAFMAERRLPPVSFARRLKAGA